MENKIFRNILGSFGFYSDDWPPQVLLTRISPNIFKFTFSLDMVKEQ